MKVFVQIITGKIEFELFQAYLPLIAKGIEKSKITNLRSGSIRFLLAH